MAANRVKPILESHKEEIISLYENNITLNPVKLYRHGKVVYLNYTGIPQCGKIQNYLYDDSTIFLQRKFEKFKMITDAN